MANLWTEDVDGERWLVNPQLIVANPRRKKRSRKTMASRKRRQPAALRKYWASRRRGRRKAKRNYASAGMIANPRRRRRSRRASARPATRRRRAVMRRSRRRAGRNPQLFGFEIPPMDAILFVGAGIVVPPLVTAYVMNMLPAEYKTSKPVYYLVKAGSVLAPSLLVRQFVSRRAGNLMLLGGVASFAIDLIKESGLVPGLGAQPFLGFYERMPGRGMGKYITAGGNGRANGAFPAMIANTPDRLSPQTRF